VIWRIRQRRTFDELRERGTRVRSGPVRMTFLPLETAEPQVAFAFGRRFGPAVDRNRARRRLRAAFLEARRRSDPLGAYQLAGSRAVLHERFDRLVVSLRSCFDELSARHPNPVERS
jgi:ribonuclease P protein component